MIASRTRMMSMMSFTIMKRRRLGWSITIIRRRRRSIHRIKMYWPWHGIGSTERGSMNIVRPGRRRWVGRATRSMPGTIAWIWVRGRWKAGRWRASIKLRVI
jgi:hypothetical protein